MCGRMTLTRPGDALRTLFDLDAPPDAVPRFNIAPTQKILVVVRDGATAPGLRVAWMRWGLVPPWAKDPVKGPPLINARAETVAEKPSFRSAFKRRRCLVPASGFYEWRAEGGRKQPYYIYAADGAPLAIAGLWEHWEGPEGDVVESCTLLTTEANDLVRPIHDRMPVFLPPAAFADWLDPDIDQPGPLLALLAPYPAAAM
ncbi:MAG: SOS response-associated peptidase, partial [Planctomycetaceae bacterium]|nr:SOS response-associated peptidase [Planctomycetaceae bacterium]